MRRYDSLNGRYYTGGLQSMALLSYSSQLPTEIPTRPRGTNSSHMSKQSLERQIRSKLRGGTPKKDGPSSPQIQPLRGYSQSLFTAVNSMVISQANRTRTVTDSQINRKSGSFTHTLSLFNNLSFQQEKSRNSSSSNIDSQADKVLQQSQMKIADLAMSARETTPSNQAQENENNQIIAGLIQQMSQLEKKIEEISMQKSVAGQTQEESKQSSNQNENQKDLGCSTEQWDCKVISNDKQIKPDIPAVKIQGIYEKEVISLETIPILQTTYHTSSLSSASSPFHNLKISSKQASKQCIQQHEQHQPQQNLFIVEQESFKQSCESFESIGSLQSKLSELEGVIGCKNLEIQKLKEQLYQAKDMFIHTNQQNRHFSLQPYQKRRQSLSSVTLTSQSELLPFVSHIHTKYVQSSVMGWGYVVNCGGGLKTIQNQGWKVQQKESKGDLSELRQVVGVVGMAQTGKTTLINGIMKGSLQTVEDRTRSSFFESKLHIVQDDSLAIFEYSLKQPISQKNTIIQTNQKPPQQTQTFNWSCSQIDELWLEFFIQKTQILVLVIDKFTAEEQAMLREIFSRLQTANQLQLKEVIVVHNYFGKGLRSTEELSAYFRNSLEYIDRNFKPKSIVDLTMYKTMLVQEQTINKKCMNVSHLLNGNLFEPFAEKYQHNTLAYCMEKFSQAINPPAHFMSSFEQFLSQMIVDDKDNELSEKDCLTTNKSQKEPKLGKLQYNPEMSSICFKRN